MTTFTSFVLSTWVSFTLLMQSVTGGQFINITLLSLSIFCVYLSATVPTTSAPAVAIFALASIYVLL